MCMGPRYTLTMRRRQNPAPHPRLMEFYDRLRDAVAEGLRAIVDRGDGSSKVFQPLDPQKPLMALEHEMDLLRLVVGGWPRGSEYERASPSITDFLAMAYAAERASRVSGDLEAATVFEFLRSCPADAKKVAKGYAAKGGLSRVLHSVRGEAGRAFAHCTDEMLAMEKPRDALAFARSEMWPIGDKWADGWAPIDARLTKMRMASKETPPFASRGVMTIDKAEDGLCAAGVLWGLGRNQFEQRTFLRAYMPGANLRDVSMFRTKLDGANLRGCIVTGGNAPLMNQAKARNADFSGARLGSIIAESADFSGSAFVDGWFPFAHLKNTNLAGCDFRGCILSGADMRYTKLTGCSFEGASVRNTQFTTFPHGYKAGVDTAYKMVRV